MTDTSRSSIVLLFAAFVLTAEADQPDARDTRGAVELGAWHRWLDTHQPLTMPTEAPAHPLHRQAVVDPRPNRA